MGATAAAGSETDEVLRLEETLRAAPTFTAEDAGATAGNPAELRRALAAAAAEDAGTAATTSAPSTVPQPSVASSAATGGNSAADAAPEPRSTAPPVPMPPTDPQASQTGQDAVKDSQEEIDQLFSDFDAALESVGGASGKTPSAQPPETGGSQSATKTAAPTDTSDVFAECDAFLKELDG